MLFIRAPPKIIYVNDINWNILLTTETFTVSSFCTLFRPISWDELISRVPKGDLFQNFGEISASTTG